MKFSGICRKLSALILQFKNPTNEDRTKTYDLSAMCFCQSFQDTNAVGTSPGGGTVWYTKLKEEDS